MSGLWLDAAQMHKLYTLAYNYVPPETGVYFGHARAHPSNVNKPWLRHNLEDFKRLYPKEWVAMLARIRMGVE